MDNDPSAAAPDPTAALDIAPETVVPTAEPGTVTPPQEVAPSVADSQMVAPTAAETEAARSGNVEVVRATVAHSLARTFQRNAPEAQADVLNAVYSRLFFWDLDLRKDLQKGDVLEVAYEWDGELAQIHSATYTSQKMGSVLDAYRFRASGDSFDSWWTSEGLEVSRRLKQSPLKEYEQVTALIKDRPSHKGMDFKTPVGTAIFAPKSGRVVRTNWNLKYNGNCIELKYNDGTTARLLHLSETAVKPGQTVAAGTRIGATGNTGRSTAPHLHYELERAGRVLDPVDYHGTTRRVLSAEDQSRFTMEQRRLHGLLAAES